MFPERIGAACGLGQRSAGPDFRSAIERVLPFPLGQVPGVGVPLSRLHRAVRLDEAVAEIAAQRLALVGETDRIEQVERELAAALHRVALSIHVDVEALARVAL